MNILVGITGGIAAYKIPYLIRLLRKAGHEVQCIATDHALQFVTPTTLETLSGRKLYRDLFMPTNDHSTQHIALKDWGDLMVVAPATANCIGKLASGIADDALSTLLLAFARKPLYICPAMNTQMWECPPVQRNLEYLRSIGIQIIHPDEGFLACGAIGNGRMAEPERIVESILSERSTSINEKAPLHGQRVLITAGPTYERIDSVRFIGNYSSGKMGFALAQAIANYGAEVELVTGPTSLSISNPAINRTDVESAQEMYQAATNIFPLCSSAILSAAVADYRPEHTADHKLKKQGECGMDLHLVQNPDILATLGAIKQAGQKLIGFALETDDEIVNAKKKLQKKNLDYIVLNSLRDPGAGFGVDTNRVRIIGRDESIYDSGLQTKQQIAKLIVDHCLL